MIMPRLVGSCLTPKISFEGEFSISIFLTLVLTHFIWLWDANAQPAVGDDIRGAVIVVDLLEPVRFLGQEKNPLQAKVKVGSLVRWVIMRKPVREAEWLSCFPTALFGPRKEPMRIGTSSRNL